LLRGLREFRAEASGLPDLKLVAETGEGDLVLDTGMVLERFRKRRSPLAVDLQDFAGAVERRGELLARLRVRRVTADQRLDFPQQRVAAGIERGPVERRIAIEALEA